MNKLLCFTACLEIVASISAFAQPMDFRKPFVPSGTTWTVEVTAKTPRPDGSDLKKIEGSRDENLRHERWHWTNGTVTDHWTNGRVILRTAPERTDIIPSRLSRTEARTGEAMSAIAELAWLKAEHYQTEENIDDRPCYLYVQDIDVTVLSDADDTTAKKSAPDKVRFIRKAWISKETGFPVRSETNTHVFNYQFTLGQQVKLSMPPDFAEVASRYK